MDPPPAREEMVYDVDGVAVRVVLRPAGKEGARRVAHLCLVDWPGEAAALDLVGEDDLDPAVRAFAVTARLRVAADPTLAVLASGRGREG